MADSRQAAPRDGAADARPVRSARSPGCSFSPTIVLLLAINIFPLIWTIRLSFTNFKPIMPSVPVALRRHRQLRRHPHRRGHLGRDAGHRAFRVLVDRAAGAARLRARAADQPAVPRPQLLDHDHPAADDAVAGGGRQFLDASCSSRRSGLFNYIVSFFTGVAARLVPDDRRRGARAVDHRAWSTPGCGRPMSC